MCYSCHSSRLLISRSPRHLGLGFFCQLSRLTILFVLFLGLFDILISPTYTLSALIVSGHPSQRLPNPREAGSFQPLFSIHVLKRSLPVSCPLIVVCGLLVLRDVHTLYP